MVAVVPSTTGLLAIFSVVILGHVDLLKCPRYGSYMEKRRKKRSFKNVNNLMAIVHCYQKVVTNSWYV
jgi:hypothetical protein